MSFCSQILSAVVATTFFFTNINLIYALDGFPETTVSSLPDSIGQSREPSLRINPNFILIPKNLGLVKESSIGSSNKLVIHIQDAHANLEAQKNISAIIEDLVEGHWTNLVGIEGAEGAINITSYREIADPSLTRQAADYFLQEALLTGPEHLAITTQKPFTIVGAEKKDLHAQNLREFREAMRSGSEARLTLEDMSQVLEKLKGKHYSAEQLALDKVLTDYHDQGLNSALYFSTLRTQAQSHNIDLSPFKNFLSLLQAQEMESMLDVKAVDHEKKEVLRHLEQSLSKSDLQNLVARTLYLRLGRISEVEYYTGLEAFLSSSDVAARFPHFHQYLQYLKAFPKENPSIVFEEAEKLEHGVKDKVFTGEKVKELDQLTQDIRILKNFFALTLSSEDLDIYHERAAQLGVDTLLKRMRELCEGSHCEEQDPSFHSGQVARFDEIASPKARNDNWYSAIARVEQFYKIAQERDRVLVENLLHQMDENGVSTAVLVTGGFHTEGMTRLLQEKGVSSLVIAPQMTSAVDNKLYLSRVMGEDAFSLMGLSETLCRVELGSTIYREAMTAGGLRGELAFQLGLAALAAGPSLEDVPHAIIDLPHVKVVKEEEQLVDGRIAVIFRLVSKKDKSNIELSRVIVSVTEGAPGLARKIESWKEGVADKTLEAFLKEASRSAAGSQAEVQAQTSQSTAEIAQAKAQLEAEAREYVKQYGETKDRLAEALKFTGATKNPYINGIRQLLRVAPYVGWTLQDVREFSKPVREVSFTFQVEMDDGRTETFEGHRVGHNDILGPHKGGVRYHQNVDLDEVRALAGWMTVKNSIAGLPYGGGKGGVKITVRDSVTGAPRYSKQELARVSRGYFREITEAGAVGPMLDIPAPDMNTGSDEMAWMVDEYIRYQIEQGAISLGQEALEELQKIQALSKEKSTETPALDKYLEILASRPEGQRQAWELAVLTGKAPEKGGSLGRKQATGWGVAIAVQQAVKEILKRGSLEGVTVRVQGFGNVGSFTALFLHRAGAKIVGVSDLYGALENPDGIDIETLFKYSQENPDNLNKSIVGFPGATAVQQSRILEGECDVLVPAALENQITEENAPRIKAKLVVEGANGPTTPEADIILEKLGIAVVPDVLANTAGVTGSYFEWLQNLRGERWTEERVMEELEKIMVNNFSDVHRIATEKKIAHRLAAYVKGVSYIIEAKKNLPWGVEFIEADRVDPYRKDVLTQDALTGLSSLTRKFRKVRDQRLVKRDENQAKINEEAAKNPGERKLSHLPEDHVIKFIDGTQMTVGQIRQGDWKVSGLPEQLKGSHVQLTGPAHKKNMVAGAMKTGQQWMADGEDAASQAGTDSLETQRNLKELNTWKEDGTRDFSGLEGIPEEKLAKLIYRARGLHLNDKHVLVDGEEVPGAFADAWLFLYHNAQALIEHNLPVIMYLPKLESVEEADLWHMFLYESEKKLGLKPGTVKVFMLDEIDKMTFQLEETMYAFSRAIYDSSSPLANKDGYVEASRFIGPNVGRWDYLASIYRTWQADPMAIPPDTNKVGMATAEALIAYELWVHDLARKRGAVPWGGMSANILLKSSISPGDFSKLEGSSLEISQAIWKYLHEKEYLSDGGDVRAKFNPEDPLLENLPVDFEAFRSGIIKALKESTEKAWNNSKALENVTRDKRREFGLDPGPEGIRRGYPGAWVATLAMVEPVQRIGEEAVRAGHINLEKPLDRPVEYTKEIAEKLGSFPQGEVTEAGLREDISVALQYMASYLAGSGAAAVVSPELRLRLMEDLATAEIRRAALWLRLHHWMQGRVIGGEGPYAGKAFTEEVFLKMLEEEALKVKGKTIWIATEILKQTTTLPKLIPWISDPLNMVIDQEDREVILESLDAFFSTYVEAGERLTQHQLRGEVQKVRQVRRRSHRELIAWFLGQAHKVREWWESSRFVGIDRLHTEREVVARRGTLPESYARVKTLSERLFTLLEEKAASRDYVTAYEVSTVPQVIEQGRMLPITYVGRKRKPHEESTQRRVSRFMKAQALHDVKDAVARRNIDLDQTRFRPIMVDADLGHPDASDNQRLKQHVGNLIKAGASGLQLTDALSDEESPLGGKVLLPASAFARKLDDAREVADVMGVGTVIMAGVTGEGATLIQDNSDPIDQPFILGATNQNIEPLKMRIQKAEEKAAEKKQKLKIAEIRAIVMQWNKEAGVMTYKESETLESSYWNQDAAKFGPNDYYQIRGGIELAVARAHRASNFADVLWMINTETDPQKALQNAKYFRGQLRFPKMAINWLLNSDLSKLDAQSLVELSKELGNLGYVFQFVQGAGPRAEALAIKAFSRDYARRDMTAYVEGVQDKEFEANAPMAEHQSWSGAGLIDAILETITGGTSSTKTMAEGNTAVDFKEAVAKVDEHAQAVAQPTDEESELAKREKKIQEKFDRDEKELGIKRSYSARMVALLQGTISEDYSRANAMAQKLREMFKRYQKEGAFSNTFGALNANQVEMMVGFLTSIYVSGWQASSTAASNLEGGPDIADYPYDTLPNKTKELFEAMILGDQEQTGRLLEEVGDIFTQAQASGTPFPLQNFPLMRPFIDYWRPIIADGDTGHGGLTAVMKLMKMFIEANAAGVHFEDQGAGTKKCGHLGGKVEVSIREQEDRLIAAQLMADIMGVDTVIVGRSDAEAARMINNNIDPRNHVFIVGTTNPDLESLNDVVRKAQDRGANEVELKAISEQWIKDAKLLTYADAVEEEMVRKGASSDVLELWRVVNHPLNEVSSVDTMRLAVYLLGSAKVREFSEQNLFSDVEQYFIQSKRSDKEALIRMWKAVHNRSRGLDHDAAKALAEAMGYGIYWNWDKPRTREGYYLLNPQKKKYGMTYGLMMGIVSGRAYAPHAHVVWLETGKPDEEEARHFAKGIHAKFPGKWLAYNCSPSFPWSKHLSPDRIAKFQKVLAKMGYVWQFITLAGIHIDAFTTDQLVAVAAVNGPLGLIRGVQDLEGKAGSPKKDPAHFQAELRKDNPYYGEEAQRDGKTDATEIIQGVEAHLETRTIEFHEHSVSITFKIDGRRINEEKLPSYLLETFLEGALFELTKKERKLLGDALRGKTITLALLDKSPTPFQNHLADGLIGISRAVFDLPEGEREVALQVGIIHELWHEAFGPDADHAEVEEDLASRDVLLTKKLIERAAKNRSISVASYRSALEVILKPQEGLYLRGLTQGADRRAPFITVGNEGIVLDEKSRLHQDLSPAKPGQSPYNVAASEIQEFLKAASASIQKGSATVTVDEKGITIKVQAQGFAVGQRVEEPIKLPFTFLNNVFHALGMDQFQLQYRPNITEQEVVDLLNWLTLALTIAGQDGFLAMGDPQDKDKTQALGVWAIGLRNDVVARNLFEGTKDTNIKALTIDQVQNDFMDLRTQVLIQQEINSGVRYVILTKKDESLERSREKLARSNFDLALIDNGHVMIMPLIEVEDETQTVNVDGIISETISRLGLDAATFKAYLKDPADEKEQTNFALSVSEKINLTGAKDNVRYLKVRRGVRISETLTMLDGLLTAPLSVVIREMRAYLLANGFTRDELDELVALEGDVLIPPIKSGNLMNQLIKDRKALDLISWAA